MVHQDLNLNEEEYYRNIYENRCEIIENKTLEKDRLCMKLINSFYSILKTAILEGHIYGHNSIYLNFYNNDFYHQDLPKI